MRRFWMVLVGTQMNPLPSQHTQVKSATEVLQNLGKASHASETKSWSNLSLLWPRQTTWRPASSIYPFSWDRIQMQQLYIYNIWGAQIPSKWLSTNKALHHQIPADTTKHCDKKYVFFRLSPSSATSLGRHLAAYSWKRSARTKRYLKKADWNKLVSTSFESSHDLQWCTMHQLKILPASSFINAWSTVWPSLIVILCDTKSFAWSNHLNTY